MRGCSAIKANGERCKGIAATGSDYCPAHDPARADARIKAASKAAKSRSATVTEMNNIVIIKETLVANQIANNQLRAVEVERRVREQDDLEIRLDELEGLLEEAEERSRYGGR